MSAIVGDTLMDDAPAQPRNRKKRNIIISILALVVVLGGAAFFLYKKKDTANAATATKDEKNGKNGKEKEKAPVPVSVAAASVAPISSYLTSTANLVAENEVKILAEAEGRVSNLQVDEGSRVSQGQLLATINPEDARITYTKAQVRANNARAAYVRAKGLADQNLISKGDFDKTAMEKDVAEQELAEAQWRLGKTSIRAPFTGVITQRKITNGQHVRPGEELFTVTDLDPLVAHIYLPERDVQGVTPGRPVRITLKAAQEVHFPGRIRYISPVVDAATGTVKMTVEAVGSPNSVRPGGFVNIDIEKETRASALVIPREAVIRELQTAHVFIVDGTVAKKRDVSIGLEESGKLEVTSGLKPGDQVIIAGQGGLKDGSKIKIL